MREVLEYKCSRFGAAYFRHIKHRVRKAYMNQSCDTVPLGCLLRSDNQGEDVKFAKASKRGIKRARQDGNNDEASSLEDLLSGSVKRQNTEAGVMIASNTERAGDQEPAVSSEIVSQPNVGKKTEEEKTDSQKQEETGSQPFPEIKSPVKSTQGGNNSTGEDPTIVMKDWSQQQ